jgi:uncharacterized membrane protein YdjX (TVP38/TMEM64 family)
MTLASQASAAGNHVRHGAEQDPGDPLRGGPTWRRVLLALLLAGAAAVLVLSDTLHAALMGLLVVTERAIASSPVAGAACFVAFSALSGMIAFVSSAVVVPVAVHAWGPIGATLLLWAGWILGGACTFALGRFLGRPLAGRLAPRWLARYERVVTRDAPFGLVALFQLAAPSEVPGYFLGVVRYSFPRYIAVVALGELPYAVGTVILGDSFLERRLLPFLLLGALAVATSAWAYARLRRRLGGDTGQSPAH